MSDAVLASGPSSALTPAVGAEDSPLLPFHSVEGTAAPTMASWSDYVVLLKPRVMSLVIFTALVGLLVAPQPIHPVLGFAALICVAVGAGAAGALNMWYDADIDRIMSRTSGRPLPRGRIEPGDALAFGMFLSFASVLTMGLVINWVAGGLLALTIAFYVVIYTAWLKRRTPQNIVIGGAAGAFPPMIGWAAATGTVSLDSVVLFAIIFMWTPPHFWALAVYRTEDYDKAGVPMMPVVAGPAATRVQILAYALLLWPLTLVPFALGTGGWLYGIGAFLLSGLFACLALRLWWAGRAPAADEVDESRRTIKRHARSLFAYSILYLFLLFLLLAVDDALGLAGQPLAGW